MSARRVSRRSVSPQIRVFDLILPWLCDTMTDIGCRRLLLCRGTVSRLFAESHASEARATAGSPRLRAATPRAGASVGHVRSRTQRLSSEVRRPQSERPDGDLNVPRRSGSLTPFASRAATRLLKSPRSFRTHARLAVLAVWCVRKRPDGVPRERSERGARQVANAAAVERSETAAK